MHTAVTVVIVAFGLICLIGLIAVFWPDDDN